MQKAIVNYAIKIVKFVKTLIYVKNVKIIIYIIIINAIQLVLIVIYSYYL